MRGRLVSCSAVCCGESANVCLLEHIKFMSSFYSCWTWEDVSPSHASPCHSIVNCTILLLPVRIISSAYNLTFAEMAINWNFIHDLWIRLCEYLLLYLSRFCTPRHHHDEVGEPQAERRDVATCIRQGRRRMTRMRMRMMMTRGTPPPPPPQKVEGTTNWLRKKRS